MSTGGVLVVFAILSIPAVYVTQVPVKSKAVTPFVAVEQLSFCTTLDKKVVAPCIGVYDDSSFVMVGGGVVLAIRFPASRDSFVQDHAAMSRVIQTHLAEVKQ